MNSPHNHEPAEHGDAGHADAGHTGAGHMGAENGEHVGHEGHAGHMSHDGHQAHQGHEGMDHSRMDHSRMEHSGHGNHADHADRADHVGRADHEGHEGHMGHGAHHAEQFKRLFWFMLVLAIPVVAFSGAFAELIGYSLPDAQWVRWISPILGTIMFVWGGRPFLTGAWSEIRSRQPGMMLLIALAITVAFVSSWGATVRIISPQLDFWWELALLIVIMLLGHWVEMRSLAQTSSALDSLAALLPDEAEKIVGDTTVTVSPDELVPGDVVVIRPGASIPADGTIVEGEASMDESMITGESRTVRRGAGDPVVAGTVATDSGLRVTITATGADTTLAGIRKLIADAQNSTSRAQRLADRAAAWLFWFALGAAVITAVVWSIVGSPEDAVNRTITVLVIACPHALGLAIPLVVSIATARAAHEGALIKDRLALESLRLTDAVLFDKTGTLTKGEPTVTAVEVADTSLSEDKVLALAAAAEWPSEHPLARAIVRAAEERTLQLPHASDFSSSPAVGVRATVDQHTIEVGGPYLLERHQASELPIADTWRTEGAIILHVLRDGTPIGALRLADEIRPESATAVQQLHQAGVEVIMITGDAPAVANAVAKELNIDDVFAGVKPQDKSATVERLQHAGKTVAMVGDGVNDAPALAQADVGIAIGAGTDVAVGSADVVLASDDPRAVVSVRELSRLTYKKMTQNLWWAAGYNLISVPLAAGILAPIGFVMPMSVGAILMSLSTVIVALNAQTLRHARIRPDEASHT